MAVSKKGAGLGPNTKEEAPRGPRLGFGGGSKGFGAGGVPWGGGTRAREGGSKGFGAGGVGGRGTGPRDAYKKKNDVF